MRLLICGLSGSGKTSLAKELSVKLNAMHLNADELRKQYNDWDFSDAGRLRQAHRIKNMSDKYDLVVSDFIAPRAIHRHIVDADILVWMDTVKSSQYKDTDKIFEAPVDYTYRITEKDAQKWAKIISDNLNENLNWNSDSNMSASLYSSSSRRNNYD
jgi:adenylylsulfate kinase